MEDCQIYYAMKANSEEGVIRALHNLGSCFECSSKEEFELSKNINLVIKDIDLWDNNDILVYKQELEKIVDFLYRIE